MKAFFKSVFSLCLLAVILLIGSFVFTEWQRLRLLESYSAPIDLLEKLREPGEKDLTSLAKSDEAITCTLNSYGSLDDLSGLNDKQKASLPKEKLPSEDGMWYLLFFSNQNISRVFSIGGTDSPQLISSTDECVNVTSHYVVSRRVSKNGKTEIKFILNGK
jgi:hypothetical protein